MFGTLFQSGGVVLLVTTAAAHASFIAVNAQAAQAACSSLEALAECSPGMLFAKPGSAQYELDIEHFSPTASLDASCSVQPSTPNQVAAVLQIIKQTRTPWAVKGHGHTYNQGFSSTTGLQIALSQFNQVTYDPNTNLTTVGTGTSWDKVYTTLDAQDVTVVGGRIFGVGTGGFTLGGGFSYKTNQLGLGSDNTVAYELVTYAGEIMNVTESSDPDLFFALQGGLNNFGIVTRFTLKTYPQSLVVAGLLLVSPENIQAYKEAMVTFSATNTDPKADLNPLFTYFDGQLFGLAFLYYDAPTLPNGTFSDFMALGATLTQQKLSSFIGEFPEPDNDAPTRWADHTAPIKGYPMELVDFIGNETERWGHFLTTNHSGTNVTCTLEMFLPTAFANSRDAAYPHSVAQFTNPLNTGALFLNPAEDDLFNEAVKAFANRIQKKAIELGQASPDAILYSNYAEADTPIELMFGENVDRLAQISRLHDPNDLLSLTGGFKFQRSYPSHIQFQEPYPYHIEL